MNTSDLSNEMAKEYDLSKAFSKSVVNFLLDAIMKGVCETGSVKLSGFGIFYKVTRKARKGRNPKTGEPVAIPEAVVPRFKPGTSFLANSKKSS
jgi:DNA-binding protein HU-beta